MLIMKHLLLQMKSTSDVKTISLIGLELRRSGIPVRKKRQRK